MVTCPAARTCLHSHTATAAAWSHASCEALGAQVRLTGTTSVQQASAVICSLAAAVKNLKSSSATLHSMSTARLPTPHLYGCSCSLLTFLERSGPKPRYSEDHALHACMSVIQQSVHTWPPGPPGVSLQPLLM